MNLVLVVVARNTKSVVANEFLRYIERYNTRGLCNTLWMMPAKFTDLPDTYVDWLCFQMPISKLSIDEKL